MGRFTKNEGLHKKLGLRQFADIRGSLTKKRRWLDTPMHTMRNRTVCLF